MHRGLNIGGSLGLKPAIAGLYDLEDTLGKGHFAVVKLARHVFTGEKVAVKVIDKSKLDDVSKAHLFQEVRCMKLVQHPNVVRLYEVIDTATKLYLILELGDGGDLYDYIMRHEAGLSEALAKEYFRQIVRAITYCHQLHVVHRDLKPENVVFFQKLGVVKLTDFGFSNKFCPGQKLETSCGSLAYSAPEILLGDSYDAPAVDVWSLGVILYMLVCGQAPFQEANDSETLTMIMDCKYSVPAHISTECKDLIARMLVRVPEKRATLNEIASHPWLATNKQESLDILPLVSKEQLSEEDHNLIVQKIVNGNIATKEEIQDCLDKNEYNHITATYFLLAERKLRSKRQETVNKGKRPEHLAVKQSGGGGKKTASSNNNNSLNSKGPNPCLLSVPRTPGDVPQRSRKCSIVQEDEEEEDISGSGREELSSQHNSLNRRGSRSEGRLNLALQERIAECDRRKIIPEEKIAIQNKNVCNIKTLDMRPRSAHEASKNYPKWKMEKSCALGQAPTALTKVMKDIKMKPNVVTTTIITESSTISIPIMSNSALTCPAIPKYRTMPSPTRNVMGGAQQQQQEQLNEIFEEGDGESRAASRRQFVSRTRAKFHKARTASCSSSDASDDDSENRKKRAHKLTTTTAAAAAKPMQARRDSHDDSSDSQEPGSNATSATGNGTLAGNVINTNSGRQENKGSSNTGNSTSGRNHNIGNSTMLGRRHKASRRRSGETRLRESQSLNRITEEEAAQLGSAGMGVVAGTPPKVKGFGARFLGGLGMKRLPDEKSATLHYSRKEAAKHVADLDETKLSPADFREEKENCGGKLSSTKKMRLLSRYFQVHKRIFVPIPGLFSRNKLYKARSCGSLTRDRITTIPGSGANNDGRGGGGGGGGGGDINQNQNKTDAAILMNMCVHLGNASKCSFC